MILSDFYGRAAQGGQGKYCRCHRRFKLKYIANGNTALCWVSLSGMTSCWLLWRCVLSIVLSVEKKCYLAV
jgi:hypothetical protein